MPISNIRKVKQKSTKYVHSSITNHQRNANQFEKGASTLFTLLNILYIYTQLFYLNLLSLFYRVKHHSIANNDTY